MQAAEFPFSHPQLLNAAGKVHKSRAERARERIERRSNPLLAIGANHERGDSATDYNDSLELSINVPSPATTRFSESCQNE